MSFQLLYYPKIFQFGAINLREMPTELRGNVARAGITHSRTNLVRKICNEIDIVP